MRIRMRPRRRALTLIELTLVAALMLVLMAMIPATLGAARHEARLRTCLGNLRTIGAGAGAYLTEFTSLPFILPTPYSGTSFSYRTEFGWGGGMPDKTASDWNVGGRPLPGSLAVQMDTYRLEPRHRPLNPYIANDIYWNRPVADRVSTPMVLPLAFRCPADSTPDWEWWGGSYAINWHWGNYYRVVFGTALYSVLGGDHDEPGNGPDLLNSASGRQAGELILFMEYRLSEAAAGARPAGYSGAPWGDMPTTNYVGWHGQLDHHNAAFRDGGARHTEIDTRFIYGDGWTFWPKRPWQRPWHNWDGIDP